MNRALHHVIMTRDPQGWKTLRSKIDEHYLTHLTDSLTTDPVTQRAFNEVIIGTMIQCAAEIFGKFHPISLV